VDRFQVTDWRFILADQAQRVDHLHPGHGGEGKQVSIPVKPSLPVPAGIS
jgi:hypothetical protein